MKLLDIIAFVLYVPKTLQIYSFPIKYAKSITQRDCFTALLVQCFEYLV